MNVIKETVINKKETIKEELNIFEGSNVKEKKREGARERERIFLSCKVTETNDPN